MRHALSLCFCLLLATSGCAPEPPGNVVLVVIDTLRADHMSLYGYDRQTTPHLDELATTGSVFEHAYSASSWTLPGVASILTGLYPSAHGAGTSSHRRIRDGVITLPQYLSATGYATAAVVNVSFLLPRFGMAAGFDHYDLEPATATELRLADESLDDALDWLDSRDSSKPFFLFLHLFDVHHQFDAPEPARGVFTAAFADRYGDTLATLESRTAAEQAGDVEFAKAAYDEEILWVDSQVGRLFEALRERDLDETTWVALTADHGEAFSGEHYHRGHGMSLYDEVMRVPLVLWGPGVPAVRHQEPVSTVDIVPTLLDLTGREVPEVSGGSLVPLMEGEEPPVRPIFARSDYYGNEIEAIVQWPYKMIVNRSSGLPGAIYDLSVDPGEFHALVDPADAQLTRLARRLRQQMREIRRDREGAAVGLSPDLERQLRALGYIQ
ncbi:MAG TPA: sulfatase [Acidobacteriota bacterium]|nr:sulfatase [Acidobacteriota bacterium]